MTNEKMPPRPRRTQGERREATIAKLINATIESLLEVGYARTSVKEICTRAGVSQGGLFRHFTSVLDVMMAAADEVARRQLINAEAGLQNVDTLSEHDAIVSALLQLREACRSPINAVFYELIVAARTDPALHGAMQKFALRYTLAIGESTLRSPVLAHFPQELRLVLLSSVLHMFDGEALTRSIVPLPEMERQRIELLARLVGMLHTNPQ